MARRATAWMGSKISFTTFGAAAAVVVGTELDFERFTSPTIIRIRGRIVVKLNASTGDTYEATSYKMGLIVAHKSTGSSEVDVDDVEQPWMWYTSGLVWQPVGQLKYWNGSAAINYNSAISGATRKEVHEVDTSAMRRLSTNERLILVLERTVEAGSPGDPEIAGHIRILVKE